MKASVTVNFLITAFHLRDPLKGKIETLDSDCFWKASDINRNGSHKGNAYKDILYVILWATIDGLFL